MYTNIKFKKEENFLFVSFKIKLLFFPSRFMPVKFDIFYSVFHAIARICEYSHRRVTIVL